MKTEITEPRIDAVIAVNHKIMDQLRDHPDLSLSQHVANARVNLKLLKVDLIKEYSLCPIHLRRINPRSGICWACYRIENNREHLIYEQLLRLSKKK